MNLWTDEATRLANFPIAREHIFMEHAAVTTFPQYVADAMIDYTRQSTTERQEFAAVLRDIARTRRVCAKLLGAQADEIALLGPTSLGLSLFANGLDWEPGDEVVCYQEDYPANVYPWLALERLGVKLRYLQPEKMGEITPELVAAAITPRTKLVALASCHFLTGYRIDHDAIGRLLHDRGVLFSLDAIQTLGAFPTTVEHVDFLSADAHKWLLGPMAAGIVYVKREHFEKLRPTLLGAWNIQSPQFITQAEILFVDSAQRYEPGVLNTPGIYGMLASIEMLLEIGMETVSERILALRQQIAEGVTELGFEVASPMSGPARSGIVTFRHPEKAMKPYFDELTAKNVIVSHRFDRSGRDYLRFSPHFYNTEDEVERALQYLKRL
ncbi:MAG TPA: aminotransferase class V-fold PLP-dependent enzyme [Chthoniobacterales bacterium]|jgi:selenocysteine lyase/cysteine desulfurase